jgi:hypothetical protein
MGLLQLRPPDWNAVKRNWRKEKKTRDCINWSVVAVLAAALNVTALLYPRNPVLGYSGYGLGFYFPMLAVLLIRNWNRTLAYPAALIMTITAVAALLYNFNVSSFAMTVFLGSALIIGATSDRLSFIYMKKPPYNYIGIVAATILTFVVVFLIYFIFAGMIALIILGIVLLLLAIRAFFGFGRRNNRWF